MSGSFNFLMCSGPGPACNLLPHQELNSAPLAMMVGALVLPVSTIVCCLWLPSCDSIQSARTGTIHHARHISDTVADSAPARCTGELLVLKVIQFDVSSDIIRKQVTTELRTLNAASHRNIVRYHQAFFDNGALYLDQACFGDSGLQHNRVHTLF